jgi:heme A synthase
VAPVRPAFKLVALAAALSTWALVAVGGAVRVTESGLGCPDWPLCHGRAVPKTEKTALLEYSHRAAALVSVLLVLLAAYLAWRWYRRRPDILWPATVALLLVPLQAVLGAVVVWLELPGWIVAVHFVVGLLYSGAAVACAAASWRDPGAPVSPGFSRLAQATLGLGLVLVSVGAAVVSAHAEEACGQEWPACNGAFVAGGGDAALQVAHRMLAYTLAALALLLALLAWRGRGPRVAGSLPLLASLAQMAFGISLVLVGEESSAHAPLAALHVAGAGAVWAALVALAALVAPLPRARSRAPAIVSAARAG